MANEIVNPSHKNPSKIRVLQQVLLDGINAKIDEGQEVDPIELALSLGVLIAENCGLAVGAGGEWIASRRDPGFFKLPPAPGKVIKGGLKL